MKRVLLIATLLLPLSSCTVDMPPGAPRNVPLPDNAFGMTGTIQRHDPLDLCTEGDVNYYLRLGKTILVRLAVHGSWDDIRNLEKAIKTGELVYVNGIRYPSTTTECYYVLVRSVQPLGVMPDTDRHRITMAARDQGK